MNIQFQQTKDASYSLALISDEKKKAVLRRIADEIGKQIMDVVYSMTK